MSVSNKEMPSTIKGVLNSFSYFHRMYFNKLTYMPCVKTLIYIISDTQNSNNDLALADMLMLLLNVTDDSESLNKLYGLFKQFLNHVCEGMIALIFDKFGKNLELSEQLPESNIDIASLSDVFRNDIKGVGLLIYNLTIVAEPLKDILFAKEDVELLEEVIRAVRQVQQFYPEFLSDFRFPQLPISRSGSVDALEKISSDNVDEEVKEEEAVVHPHIDYLEKLYAAFRAAEVLDPNIDVKVLKAEMPANLVLDDALWERCIRVIKVLAPTVEREDPQTEAFVDLLRALFSHVPDVNVALRIYWEHCHEPLGPLTHSRFNIRQSLRQFERSMGSHNQATEKQIKPMIELLAWLLIGDTRKTLSSILRELIQNEQLVPFFRKTVRYLPIVNNYETPSGSNLILVTMAEIIADFHSKDEKILTNQASSLLIKLSQSYNDNTPSILSPTQLLDFAVKEYFEPKSSSIFWLRVASKLVEGAVFKRHSVINWEVKSKLPHNPFVLGVFMMKSMATNKSADVIGFAKNIITAVAKVLNLTPELKAGCHALDAVDDVHWALKFATVQRFGIPEDYYKLQVPSAMFSVLSEQDKANFRELRYGSLTLGEFLTSMFEIGLVGGNVPDVFLHGAAVRHISTENSNTFSLALLTALKNVRKLGVETFEPSMLQFINKVATGLNYEIFAPLVDAWTPQTFKTLSNLQNIRFIALAFRIAVEMHLHANSLGEAKISLLELIPEAQLLFTTYCTVTYKRLTELRNAFRKEEYFKHTSTNTDGNIMTFTAYLNAVSMLFVDTLNLALRLEPLPDELISLMRELRGARSLAERTLNNTFNVTMPKISNTRGLKRGKRFEEEEKNKSQKNGSKEAVTAADNPLVHDAVAHDEKPMPIADQLGSSCEAETKTSNAHNGRQFNKRSYRHAGSRSGGRKYRN